MKKGLKFLLTMCMISVVLLCSGCSFSCTSTSLTKGVWWWDTSLDDSYLNFAHENKINEIYYCDSGFNQETSAFIKKANDKGMKVYLLAGEYEWIGNREGLDLLIEKYKSFQSEYGSAFAGIHLDIEPHQSPNWEQERKVLIAGLLSLIKDTKTQNPDISFDYDIPFWFDDEIEFQGEVKRAFEHVIDLADRVFVMSYRDTVEDIYECYKDEYDYGRSVSKKVLFAVETGEEENKVTFKEEGLEALSHALETLSKQLDAEISGYAVHNIKSWKNLK